MKEPFLVFQMHYCSPLRVVERSWSVEHPWKKKWQRNHFDSEHLKTKKWKSYHREKKWKLAQEWRLAAHGAIQLDVSSPVCLSIIMIMMMIIVMTTKRMMLWITMMTMNIDHDQTENHLYKLPHRKHPTSRAGNDEHLHLGKKLDFASPLWLCYDLDKTDVQQLKNNNSLTSSRLLLKYWPTIKVAASRAIPTPTPVCYMICGT